MQEGDTIGWNGKKKEGKVAENDAGYVDPKRNGIFIDPELTPAEKERTLNHEQLHLYFHQRGIDIDEDDKIAGGSIGTIHHVFFRNYGAYQPTPNDPGGGCFESVAARRARLLFDCLFVKPQVAGGIGPQPVTRPVEPGGPMLG